jgi:hypothetical protein
MPKTMRNPIKKLNQTGLIVILAAIAAYGLVYAEQACCNNIVTDCILSLKTNSRNCTNNYNCKPSPSHYRKVGTPSQKNEASLGGTGACCENDYCRQYPQTNTITVSSVRKNCEIKDDICCIDKKIIISATNIPARLPALFEPPPIYILNQTILC